MLGSNMGSADCDIYRRTPGSSTVTLRQETNLKRKVYNFTATAIPASTAILAIRDKYGSYFADMLTSSGGGGGGTPGGPANAIQTNGGTFYGDAQFLYVPGAYGTTPYQEVVYHASTAVNTGGGLVLSPTYYFARTVAAAHQMSLGRTVYVCSVIGTPTVFVDEDVQSILGAGNFYGQMIWNLRNDVFPNPMRTVLKLNGAGATGGFGIFGQCVGQQAAITPVAGTAGAAYGATEQTMINDLKAAINAWLTAASTASGGYGFIP